MPFRPLKTGFHFFVDPILLKGIHSTPSSHMNPPSRYERSRNTRARVQPNRFSESELVAVERQHPKGMSVQEIVDVFTNHGDRLTPSVGMVV